MEPTVNEKQDLIDYIKAFEYDRLEMVELTMADRKMIINALEKISA